MNEITETFEDALMDARILAQTRRLAREGYDLDHEDLAQMIIIY